MPASPVIVKKLTSSDTATGLEMEMMRQAHFYKNDVDKSLSHLNQSFCEGGGMEAAIERRISSLNLKRKLRSDAVRAVGIIVSIGDKEMTPETAQAYLMAANDWFDERFGKANTVAWSIHMDEGTPHLHRWQVPVIAGSEPGEYDRVSAKELFNPSSLKELQRDFYEGCSKRWGFDPPLSKEQRKESGIKYAGFQTLKKQTEISRMDAEYEAAKTRLEAVRRAEASLQQGPIASAREARNIDVLAGEVESQGNDARERIAGLTAKIREVRARISQLLTALKEKVVDMAPAPRKPGELKSAPNKPKAKSFVAERPSVDSDLEAAERSARSRNALRGRKRRGSDLEL